jgi:hypothetical protein
MIKPEVKLAILSHHTSGVLFGLNSFVSGTGFANQPEPAKQVAAWMLFGGGVSALSSALVNTRDFEVPRQMKQAAGLQLISYLSFMYARFVVLPREAKAWTLWNVEEAKRTGRDTRSKVMQVAIRLLQTFNIVIALILTKKTARYLLKAFVTDRIDLNDAVQ